MIARAGKPVALLVPAEPKPKRGMYGKYKGRIWMSEDFNDPLPWELFPGFPIE